MDDPDETRNATAKSADPPTRARQGLVTGHVRWILMISTGLAIVAIAAVAGAFN